MLDILEMQTIKHVKIIVSQAAEMSFFLKNDKTYKLMKN